MVAVSEGICVSLGEPPGDYEGTFEAPTIEVVDSPDLPPVYRVFGASLRDGGQWDFRSSDSTRCHPVSTRGPNQT